MIVDAYTTVGMNYLRSDPVGLTELHQAMDRAGVDLAFTMSLRALYADARKGNEFLFSTTSSDSRTVPIGVFGPHSNPFETAAIVEACIRNGATGLAYRAQNQSVSLSSLSFRHALAEAVKPGLPLIFPGITAGGIVSQLAEMTQDTGCPLVILGPYYGLLAEMLLVLERYPYVYMDTGWQITPSAIELLVEHAGPDRILFGSGAPVRPVQPALNTVLDADIDVDSKRKILSINALRIFGRGDLADEVERQDLPLPEVKKPGTPVIDVHCHLGVLPEVPMRVTDVDAVAYHVEREGFEYAVCSAPVAYREDIDLGNQEMLDKIAVHPKLLGSPVITPTHMETSIKWLDIFVKSDRLAHVTLDPDNEAERTGSDAYMQLLAEAAIRKVPIFYNSGAQDLSSGFRWQRKLGYNPWIRGTSPEEFAMFVEADRRHPDLPIIIGHGMGEDGLRLAKQTGNIYLEFSGSYPERDAIRKAIDQIGPERVVFGTDLDMITPAFALGVYSEADMTTYEERLVMAENSRRILRLPSV